jgi:uncharacterized protein
MQRMAMIAIDTNLLVYAHRKDTEEHARAKAVVASLSEGLASFGIPYHCLLEFFGIVTHRRIYLPPSTTAQAIAQVDVWLESPVMRVLTEDGTTSWAELKVLIKSGSIAGPRVHDARIAGVCLQHGVSVLLSADRDYGRFPMLKVKNPLADFSGVPPLPRP